jgi:hypothetical protein
VTPSQGYKLDLDFIRTDNKDDTALAAINDKRSDAFPPMFHIIAEDATPSLTPSEMERVDTVLGQSSYAKPRNVPQSIRDQVLGTEKPDVSGAWTEKSERGCAHCGLVPTGSKKKLMVCSGSVFSSNTC